MDKSKKMGQMAKPAAKKAGVFIVKDAEMDDSKPSAEEAAKMRQMLREKKMDEDTERGANQYEDTKMPQKKAMGGMVSGYAKGGMVSKGNGCAIRGIKKCKMY